MYSRPVGAVVVPATAVAALVASAAVVAAARRRRTRLDPARWERGLGGAVEAAGAPCHLFFVSFGGKSKGPRVSSIDDLECRQVARTDAEIVFPGFLIPAAAVYDVVNEYRAQYMERLKVRDGPE